MKERYPYWLKIAAAFFLIAACGTTALSTPPLQASEPTPQPISSPETITKITALNPITLQITFSAPLPNEDIELEKAKQNFVFDQELMLQNIPQLKTGATAIYIVPTTPQKPGTTYTLIYKGQNPVTFAASSDKIPFRTARQVAYDTFEIESSLKDQVTDYQNIAAADVGKRGGLEFELDENNTYQGKQYQIVPSLRGAQVSITPEGRAPITATYVPFTQATDGRQAPKFRLPDGQVLEAGVKYTVTVDWAIIKTPTFKAKKMAPLVIRSVKEASPTTVDLTLAKDPKDELFALRRISLTAPDGTKLTAQYKYQTRKGATGTFELVDGTLSPNTTYTVSPIGEWATAKDVSVKTN